MTSLTIADHRLPQLSAVISARLGLHFPAARLGDLERLLKAATPELGYATYEDCAEGLLRGLLPPAQLAILARHLTVGETYFFRDPAALAHLRTQILPPLIQARRGRDQRLSLWSAACCTGEEPYTLAIMLTELLPDWRDWQITLLGSDLNEVFLAKAETATYTPWSFRGTPPAIHERYFRPVGHKQVQLLPHLRQMVTLVRHNLVHEHGPRPAGNEQPFDIILCRNVLMYFSVGGARRVVRRLAQELAPGGWLLVSPCELSMAQHPPLVPVPYTGGVVLCKGEPRSPTWEAPVAPATALAETALAAELELGAEAAPATESEPAATVMPVAAEVLPAPPGAPPISYATALAHYAAGDYRAAAVALQALLELGIGEREALPPATSLLVLLARATANMRQLEDALRWCERGLAMEVLTVDLHYLQGTILQALGRPTEATAAVRRALFLKPDFALAWETLGNLAHQQGKPEAAARHFANALALLRQPSPAARRRVDDEVPVANLTDLIGANLQAEPVR